jgi:hypothetical protein
MTRWCVTRHGRMAVAALLLAGVAACGSEPSDAAASAAAVDPAAKPAAARAPNTAGTDGADDRPVRQMTESDRLRLEMADGACRNNDFKGFFQAFTGSWAVREKYTAAKVGFGETGKARKIDKRRYLDQNHYPLATIDYFFVTAESAMKFDMNGGDSDDLRYVQVEFNQSGDNRVRIDWLPGIFEMNLTPPPEDLQEGLGDLVQETGSGGYLLFFPTESCWELVDDIANPPLEI